MLKEMNMESLKYSISIYLSYILFMIIVCVFVGPTEPVHSFKYFLTDILGRNFFYKNVFIYYFTEGTIRFFIVPYIYSFLGITFSFLFNKKRDLILEPLILYYGISFIAQFLIAKGYVLVPSSVETVRLVLVKYKPTFPFPSCLFNSPVCLLNLSGT